MSKEKFIIKIADNNEREQVYRLRHEVYAKELKQYEVNNKGILTDFLDEYNIYIIAKIGSELAGFISITPPGVPKYSIDKYIKREDLPFEINNDFYEIRALTIAQPYRLSQLTFILMYSSLRYVEFYKGGRIALIGRIDYLNMYLKSGLVSHGIKIKSGEMVYELLSASMERMKEYSGYFDRIIKLSLKKIDWKLDFPYLK